MESGSVERGTEGSREVGGRMLRIATIYRNFTRTGSVPGIFVSDAEALSRDFDVTVVCSRHERSETSAPLRFRYVEPLVRGRARATYALEVASFATRAGNFARRQRSQFDVVQAMGLGSWWADIVYVQAVRPAELQHHFENVDPMPPWHPRRAFYGALRPVSTVARGIERSLYRRGDPLCVTPSEGVRRDLIRHYRVQPDRAIVIPDPVDVDAYRRDQERRTRLRREISADEDEVVAILVGYDFVRKGLSRVIRGIARSSRRPRLIVIGGSDPAPYQTEAQALGVGDRVAFLGRLDPAEARAWYSAADLVMLSSSLDSWGAVVIEGMAAGCIPLVSTYAGAHEAVRHGEDGFVLARDGSPAEIAAILDGPLADAEARGRLSSAAIETASGYTPAVLYPRHVAAVRRAFELRRSRGE